MGFLSGFFMGFIGFLIGFSRVRRFFVSGFVGQMGADCKSLRFFWLGATLDTLPADFLSAAKLEYPRLGPC